MPRILRVSLPIALGLAALACGGSAIDENHERSAGGSAQAGTLGIGDESSRGGGSGGSSRGGASAMVDCPNPVFNKVSKLVECSNGLRHRAERLNCDYAKARPKPSRENDGDGGAGGDLGFTSDGSKRCSADAECVSDYRYGYCDTSEKPPVCRAGCLTDPDCGEGSTVCICDGITPGRCSYGCDTDAECKGAWCAPIPSGVCGPIVFSCTTPEDECINSSDCMDGQCALVNGHRVCVDAECGFF